jgi:hypothetical protein
MPTAAPIVLLPIQPAPLPYQFRFTVHCPPQAPKHTIAIGVSGGTTLGSTWSLADQDVIEPCGFSSLLRRLLKYAKQQDLWGQTIQLYANYAQPNGVMLNATRSAPQSLQLPMKPILLTGLDRVANVAQLPCGVVLPPQGHRLLWTQLPSDLSHSSWYVGPNNRLCEVGTTLGLDRYSFWVSALGLPIKNSANIQTGDAFASMIGAARQPRGFAPPKPSVAQIVAAASADPWLFESCIFWNATRLLFYSPHPHHDGFCEFGPGGFRQMTPAQFASGQAQDALWNLRLHPKLTITGGQASVM